MTNEYIYIYVFISCGLSDTVRERKGLYMWYNHQSLPEHSFGTWAQGKSYRSLQTRWRCREFVQIGGSLDPTNLISRPLWPMSMLHQAQWLADRHFASNLYKLWSLGSTNQPMTSKGIRVLCHSKGMCFRECKHIKLQVSLSQRGKYISGKLSKQVLISV